MHKNAAHITGAGNFEGKYLKAVLIAQINVRTFKMITNHLKPTLKTLDRLHLK